MPVINKNFVKSMNMIFTANRSRLLLKYTILSSQTHKLFGNSVVASKLTYAEHGVPYKVIRKENDDIIKPKQNQVLLKMLASPVNPVDINVIEGKYVFRPKLPTVAGSEGVGEVISVGEDVSHLKEGDRAVILKMDIGSWRTHLTISQNKILKVPKELELLEAATLVINPPTAYRMLKDFVDLKPGDTVIQNGANSACGQQVIQLARIWGIRTVNIIRTRPNVEELKNFLISLGATYVLTDEELKSTDIFKSGNVAQPSLALECVGGKSASGLLSHLCTGSKMVVYGGMSKQPVPVPTPALIFKDVHVCGIRINQWMVRNEGNVQWHEMFDELTSLMVKKQLRGPVHEFIHLNNYKKALDNTITEKGMVGKKFVLSLD